MNKKLLAYTIILFVLGGLIHLFNIGESSHELAFHKIQLQIEEASERHARDILAAYEVKQLQNMGGSSSETPFWTAYLYKRDSLAWWSIPSIFDQFSSASPNLTATFYNADSSLHVIHHTYITKPGEKEIVHDIIKAAGVHRRFEIVDNSESKFQLNDGLGKTYSFVPTSFQGSEQLNTIEFILFFVSTLMLLFWAYQSCHFSQGKVYWPWVVFVSIRILQIWTDFFDRLCPNYLLQEAAHLDFISPSFVDLFFNGLTAFLLAIFIFRKTSLERKYHNTTFEAILWVLGIVLSTLALLLYFIHGIPSVTAIIDVSRIFRTSLNGYLFILGYFFLFLSVFVLHYYLTKSLISLFPNGHKRMLVGIMHMALFSVLFFCCHFPFPLIYGIVGYIAYNLLLDLFVDKANLSLSWVMWWMIVVGSIITLLLFKGLQEANQNKIISTLQENYHTLSPEKLRAFRSVIKQLDSSKVATVASINTQLNFNDEEIRTYLFGEIDQNFPDQSHQLHITQIADNNDLLASKNPQEELYLRNQLATSIPLDTAIVYDPITDAYIHKIQGSVNANNPDFKIYLSLVPHDLVSEDTRLPYTLSQEGKLEFAVYKDFRLVLGRNKQYPEKKEFGENVVYPFQNSYIENGQNHIEYRPNAHYTLLYSEPLIQLIKPISLFSFLFTLLGLLLLIIGSANNRFIFLPEALDVSFGVNSLRDRIQISVVMLIVLSFVVIGLVTVYYFQQLSDKFKQETLIDKVSAVNRDLQSRALEYQSTREVDYSLDKLLRDISEIQKVDIILYDEYGNIITKPYSTSFPGFKMPFNTYAQLKSKEINVSINRMAMGRNDEIYTSYNAITNDFGRPLAYLQILSPKNASTTISANDFMGTMLNVYVFLFLIAGALAIAVANSITYPISVLGEKLKDFKLGKRNEPLEWQSKDELGELIQEYNLMISKLEESANLIARTERDTAWREMAKQVAHEIKNPLTPMKLSIQYLQRAVEADPSQALPMIRRISSTIIEQINNLSQIAGEFSNFAKLPQARNGKIVLNEVVETVHDLFRKRDDMEIKLIEPIDEVVIFADRNQLVRILNNLIKNAIQAIPSDRHGKIVLNLYIKDESAIISVQDNGTGISDDMKDKVFAPNFTTKSSGTGLGLAIAANMIDTMNGKIYFDTQVDVGTTFYIEIPLMRYIVPPQEGNRVTLDG